MLTAVPEGQTISATYTANGEALPVFLASPATLGTTPGVKLNGKIHDFMDEDGNMMEGWIVNLLAADHIDNSMFDKKLITSLIDPMSGADGAPTTLTYTQLNAILAGTADAPMDEESFGNRLAAIVTAHQNALAGDDLTGDTTGIAQSMEWTGVWDAKFRGLNLETLPVGVHGRFHASAGTPLPITTPEGVIKNLEDLGYAGVVGAFGARR